MSAVSADSASPDSTNHRVKMFRKKKISRKFQEVKLEFATYWHLFTQHLHCIYNYLHSIYIVLGINNLEMI